MGYRVRSADGELHFPGIYDVEKAWMQGLVDPDDEIIEDGKSSGPLAKEHPYLTRQPARRQARFPSAQTLRTLFVAVMGVAALCFWQLSHLGLVLKLAIVAVMVLVMLASLSGLLREAHKLKRR